MKLYDIFKTWDIWILYHIFNNDLHLLISENAEQRLLDLGSNIKEKHIMGFFSIFFKKIQNPKKFLKCWMSSMLIQK
jgi:hypothetical protein